MLLPHESGVSLLTHQVRQCVRNQDWPKGVSYSLQDRGSFVRMYMYRDNFLTFTGEEMSQIASCINTAFAKIRADGIPIYLEVLATKEERDA